MKYGHCLLILAPLLGSVSLMTIAENSAHHHHHHHHHTIVEHSAEHPLPLRLGPAGGLLSRQKRTIGPVSLGNIRVVGAMLTIWPHTPIGANNQVIQRQF